MQPHHSRKSQLRRRTVSAGRIPTVPAPLSTAARLSKHTLIYEGSHFMRASVAIVSLLIMAAISMPKSAGATFPVCVAPGSQDQVALAAGDSFAVIVWRDNRNSLTSSFDIYGQALGHFGSPLWGSGTFGSGAPICTAIDQQDQVTVSVGSGGITSVAWRDARICGPGRERIFAQDLSAGGQPLFAVDGDSVDTTCPPASPRGSRFPRLLSLAGTVNFLAWNYRATGSGELRVRKRVDGSPAPVGVGALWAVPFICLPDIPSTLTTDAAGGVLAAFPDACCGNDLHGRRADAASNILWTESHAHCVGDPNFQIPPRITVGAGANQISAPDGAGGMIVAWEAGSVGSRTIRAQRLDANGNRLWGDSGKLVCGGPGDLQNPQLIRSTSGRSFVVWEAVYSSTESDLYVQRINLLGDTLGARIPICTATLTQTNAQAAAAPNGGCFIVWEDLRDTGSGDLGDIYVQRLDAAGNVACTGNGERMPAPVGTRQSDPRIVAVPLRHFRDGEVIFSHALIVWSDDRNGNPDLYGWYLEDNCPLVVLDAVPTPRPDGARFKISVVPNPSVGSVRIVLTLTKPGAVSAVIYDLTGRSIRMLASKTPLPIGQQTIAWDGRNDKGETVDSGVYFCEVVVDGRRESRRVSLIR